MTMTVETMVAWRMFWNEIKDKLGEIERREFRKMFREELQKIESQ